MLALRAERAKLLGFATFADFKLDDTMAKTPAAVRGLLERVWGDDFFGDLDKKSATVNVPPSANP